MKRTLTSQLLLLVTPTLVVILLATAVLAFFSCRREINYVHDMQMANDANVLWALVKDEIKEEAQKKIPSISHGFNDREMPIWDGDADDYGSARMFRIWQNKKILMHSDTALPDTVPQEKSGYSNIVYDGTDWRVFTMVIGDGAITMEVGEHQSLRDALIGNILLDLFIPLLLMLPVIWIGLWLAIRVGVRPIQTLVHQIQRRNADDLAEVIAYDLPRDLKPLAKSINQLFAKLADSLNAERRFASHAAHQLRTPLAGSRLLIQMLENTNSREERDAIIADLSESNARAIDLIQKLLLAARISHQRVHMQSVTLYPIIARAIAELARVAEEKSLILSLEGDESVCITADETLLALMATNIIENAVKYTQIGGKIEVKISATEKNCRLSVIDNGPGIPEAEYALVFERFYRSETTQSEGTGLGLTMVADIVERFGGTVTLKRPKSHQGLQVDIDLPKI